MENSTEKTSTHILSAFTIKKEQENFGDIMQSIRDGVTFRGTNLWVLIFAIFIASIGLNVNSTAVIIGAMLISPLMGPIIGMGVSIGINDSALLKRSLKNYAFAIVVSLLTSTFYFFVSPISDIHSELLARTSPNIYDVLIAFFGGLAGAIAVASQKKWNVIPWVAIATALMPPLCTVGFGIATLRADFILWALYLFFINTVFIVVATVLVSRFLRFPYKEFPDHEEKKRSIQIITFVVLLTILPSIYFAYDVVKQNNFTTSATNFIEKEAHFAENYLLKKTIDPEKQKITLIFGGKEITKEQIENTKKRLEIYGIENAELDIRQGFASLYQNDEKWDKNSTYKLQIEKLSQELGQKEIEITKLSEEIHKNQKLSEQIFKEAQSLFPKVASISLSESEKISENTKDAIFIIAIFSEKDLENSTKDALKKWLKTRLQKENIEYIFIVS